MRAKELLDGIRVRSGRVGRNQRIEELQEPFRGARREAVDRMTDDVGMNMLAKVEANRKAARAGTLRVVVGDGRNSREVREANSHPAWNSAADTAPASAKQLPTKA
jgi:acetylglutamate kinase